MEKTSKKGRERERERKKFINDDRMEGYYGDEKWTSERHVRWNGWTRFERVQNISRNTSKEGKSE